MFDGVVLGIDPGLSRCGYGAVRQRGQAFEPIAFGVLRTEPKAELPLRLSELEQELTALCDEIRPDALAVERVLFQVNTRTAMSVGQASGIALLVAQRAGVSVTCYSPNTVKQSVTGNGAADKLAVQQMVQRLLNLSEVPDPPDAADALALALCHLWHEPLRAAAAQEAP